MDPLQILYQDEHIVAINKPHGLFVHRSNLTKGVDEFAVQQLRDQIGQKVFPIHRLDRKTSGVLLFALHYEANKALHSQFVNGQVEKYYLAIARGYTEDEGVVDYALTNDNGKLQEAVTHYRTIARAEIPVAYREHSSVRYSLLEVNPKSGRMHQIRKHLKHLRHPILADRPYGCNKQNKFVAEQWNLNTMMLHARKLSFNHPDSGNRMTLTAELHGEFVRMSHIFGWQEYVA